MSGLRFQWDERKNRSNKRKHGVSFEEAKTVFLDDNARLIDGGFLWLERAPTLRPRARTKNR